jgi:hypothetical protein
MNFAAKRIAVYAAWTRLVGVIRVQRQPVVGLILAVVLGGQVLAANPAAAPSSGAPGPGIFVPKPRGSEDSLDPNAAVGAQTGATVIGRSGDRLTGSVNSIANGVVRFSGPFFDKEVGILTAGIRDIQFPARGGAESGRDMVVLTNDDRIFGRVQGMTATDLAFDSATAGFLKINNRYVKQIGFQGAAGALARTNFAGGQPSPLQIAAGGWQINGGTMRFGPVAMATLPLEQSAAVTAVIQFGRMGQTWGLSLFADQPGKGEGELNQQSPRAPGGAIGVEGRALTLALARNNGYSVTSWKGSGQRSAVISGLPAKPGEAQEVRFAYDPATTEVKLWVNNQIVNESKAPDGPKQGRYVVFSVQDFCDVKSFAVLEGVVAPAKASEEADPNNETVLYRNGERMHAEKVTLADGVFTIKTTFSEQPLSVPAQKVASINMRQANRETLPPPEQPVQVCLPKSLITVELVELTAKSAVARSPYLGQIQIARDAIQSLRFVAPTPK